MDEQHDLDDDQKKMILDALTKWVKKGVQIFMERKINRNNPALVKEALRDSWEEMVLEILHGFDKPMPVFIWVTKSPPEKERIARGKDYSLEAYERRVLAQFEGVS